MNILDLRNDLIKAYEDLKAGKLTLREAKEQSNIAGKIMNSATTQMKYNIYSKRQTKIKFLEVDE